MLPYNLLCLHSGAFVLFSILISVTSAKDKQGTQVEFNFTKFCDPSQSPPGVGGIGWDESLIAGQYHCEKLSDSSVAGWNAVYLGFGNTPQQSAALASADVSFNVTSTQAHHFSVNLTYNNVGAWEELGPFSFGQTLFGSSAGRSYQVYTGLIFDNTILSTQINFGSASLWEYTMLTFDKTHLFSLLKVGDLVNTRNCTRVSSLPTDNPGDTAGFCDDR